MIVATAIYGVLFYLSRKHDQVIEEITVKKQKIMAVPIADTLYTLKNLNLTGQTKRTYESWQATWQTVTRFRFPEIEAELVSAKQSNEKLNYFKTKRAVESAEAMIEDTKKDIDKIFDALQKLLDSEKQNKAELDELQESYSQMRKDLLAHSFSFGQALEALEKRLSYLELDFTSFNTLTNEGDHLEAKEVLTRIQKDMGELKEIIELVPQYFKELEENQIDQIDDLKQGYEALLKEKFQFNKVDIQSEIQAIEASVEKAKEYIAVTELDNARKEMDKATREIHHLYDVMEAEVDARRFVYTHKASIEKQMEIVLQNNRYAMLEIDRISQNYLLNNNEAVQLQEFQERLNTEKEAMNYYDKALSDYQVAYSIVREYYELAEQKLAEIDKTQTALVTSLASLRQQEKDIRDNLDVYELDLRNMKRTIEKYHLPGLPKEYLELFFSTSKKIEELSQKLNRVKIDMQEIVSLNTMIEEDIEELDEKTEQIIDCSQLTEYMIQHANRYRLSNESIESAISQALDKFRTQYKYEEAVAIMEQALESVEPGASQKVRQIYQSEKNSLYY